MKNAIIIALLLCLLPCGVRAQKTATAEKEVRALETRRFRAMETADFATLDQILSDDLVYTHANGQRQSKFDVIGVLGSKDFHYESISPFDLRVHIYAGSAVVAGRATIKLDARGEKQLFEICYLGVYVKQNGRWQMVAWQSSRVSR